MRATMVVLSGGNGTTRVMGRGGVGLGGGDRGGDTRDRGYQQSDARWNYLYTGEAWYVGRHGAFLLVAVLPRP